ncbi:hypothetical protein, partial [Kitasatospora sp. NPDC047058]|uniref:hypothetical protein n=1 Tax=Kitasatospora sp. NPDC047058 TaxID=3155620 RepID=UPI0033E86C3F
MLPACRQGNASAVRRELLARARTAGTFDAATGETIPANVPASAGRPGGSGRRATGRGPRAGAG